MKNRRAILAILTSLFLIVAVAVFSLSSVDDKPLKATSNIDYGNSGRKTFVRQQSNYSSQMQIFTSPINSTSKNNTIKVDKNRVASAPLAFAKPTSYTVINTHSSTTNQAGAMSLSGTSTTSYSSTSNASKTSSTSSAFSTTNGVGTISLSESFVTISDGSDEALTRAFGDYNKDPGTVVPVGSVLPLLILGALYAIRKMFFIR